MDLQRKIIELFREEWQQKKKKLREQLEKETSNRMLPGLRIKHKESGIKYTVSSIGPRDVILKTPENEEFLVDADELQKSYVID